MSKPVIHKPGTRHKLNQTVNKVNYDFIASNITVTGHKNVTELFDAFLASQVIKVQRKLSRKEGYGTSYSTGDNPNPA